jgi:Tol biopolymer transport system component
VTNTVDLDEGDPAWSPDGRRIVFTGITQHNWQVFVSDTNGAHRRKITHSCDLCEPLDYDPSWQPLP